MLSCREENLVHGILATTSGIGQSGLTGDGMNWWRRRRPTTRIRGASRYCVMLQKPWTTIRVLYNNGFSYSKAGAITMTVAHFTFGLVIEESLATA